MIIFLQRRQRRGILLLEVMIAMGLLAMLVGMIVGIGRSSLQLSNAVIETRLENSEKMAFISMMRRIFAEMPGDGEFNLQIEDNGRHILSTLTFRNVPAAFNWGGELVGAEAFQIVTAPRRDAYLDIVLKVYDEEVLTPTGAGYLDVEPVLEVTLLEGVNGMEWTALDRNRNEPEEEWFPKNRRPMHVNLWAVFEPEGRVVNHTFWIVPKQNPAVTLRTLGRDTGGNDNGGNGDGGVTVPVGGNR